MSDKPGRKLTNTLQVDIEIRLDITDQPDISEETLRRLAGEEWSRAWANILMMLEIVHPHITVSSKDMEKE